MARKKKTTDELLERILENLDLLVNLVALLVTSEKSVTEGARSLKMAEVVNQTIGRVAHSSSGFELPGGAPLRYSRVRVF